MKIRKYGISVLAILLMLLLGVSAAAEDEKPGWYPEAGTEFRQFHDPDAPRVVDKADIFTDEEEAKMVQLISAVRNLLGQDIVVYTDMEDYGINHEKLLEDFYDYNGYGEGDDFSGFGLFICMKPGNRDWWTTTTGSAEKLLTEYNLNELDDLLEPYMIKGEYGAGVKMWLNGVTMLSKYGYIFTPDWYPDLKEQAGFVRFHDTEGSKVIDLTGGLTDAAKEKLEDQFRKLSDQNGLDLRIVFDRDFGDLGGKLYAESYYRYQGLGYGDRFDGLLVVCSVRDGLAVVYGEGEEAEKLLGTSKESRLAAHLTPALEAADLEEAGQLCADKLSFYFRFHLMPHTGKQWTIMGMICMIPSLIFGTGKKNQAAARMKTVRSAYTATKYLVNGSLTVESQKTIFLGTETKTSYSPRSTGSSSSSGSSSSGRSTYHSSHSGSSGTSHTSGGGRKF